MSLIESDSIYNLFQNQDLGIDFTSSIVPDSPNKFGQKKNNNNNNNNSFNNYQQSQQHQQQLQQQLQNKQSNTIYNNSNNTNQQQSQQVFINNNQNEELFSIFLQPEKESDLNSNNNDSNNNNNNNNNNSNNVNNNVIHSHQQHHQQQQQQFNMYPTNNGIVPNQEQIKKMEYMNSEQIKQNHYNIVPESVFDVPFGISPQPMLNMQQQQQQNNQKINFKQPLQPNQQLIPIPPTNLNNPQVSIIHQIPQPQPQPHNLNHHHHHNTTNGNSINNNNNNNNNKKKEEDKSIKKRKFISSTPVKGENGTTLIPTTDGSFNLDEERHMKRQRRLVKNREAAQLFRQRQKAYIQDLEKKVSDLTGTNSEFRARVELLNSENKLIREQLLYLRNFVTQAVSFSFPKGAPGSNSPNGAADQFLNSILPPGLSNSPLPQGLLPAGMNLQNPMIMSAIAEAASKNSTFRQNIQGNLLGTPIPSPQSSLSSNSGNNSPSKQQQQQQPNNNPSSPNNNNNNNTNNTNISPSTSSSHQVPYLNTPPQNNNSNSPPNQR